MLQRKPGFPADGIDLEFYHFLCHKSPRLWSMHFDQCQHFCLYNLLLKCCTLSVWCMVIFTLKNLKSSIFSLLLETATHLKYDVKWVWINTFCSSKRCDFFVCHLSTLKLWMGFLASCVKQTNVWWTLYLARISFQLVWYTCCVSIRILPFVH